MTPGEIEHAFNMIADAKKAVQCVPSSRELSLVLTKLDEAQMWFQRAVPPINEESAAPEDR